MKKPLTQKQKDIIIDNQLTNMVNVSIPQKDMGMFADFYDFYLEQVKFSGFASIVREAMRCLMASGLDWQVSKSDNGKLDDILAKLDNLKVVAPTENEEDEEDNKGKLKDISEGFFTE